MSAPQYEPEMKEGPRITFQAGELPEGTGVPRGRALRRSLSRDTSASRDSFERSRPKSRAGSTSGFPVGFRTLSIQLSEGQGPEPSSKNADDHAYFESLDYHLLKGQQVCERFNVVQQSGLDNSTVQSRLQRDGKNTIPQRKENYLKKLFFYLFGGFCSVLWIGVIVFFLCWKPLSDPPAITNMALAILVIIVILLQALFAAFQDWSTAKVMNSILDLLPSEALVTRDGTQIKISATELVVGDIVTISIGNKVPADLRLLTTSGDIRFDRAVLTGESDEIDGSIETTDENFLESRNVSFMGTGVTNGNATGIVVLTGGRTVMGRIAAATSGVKPKPTLIQQEITRFVKIIVCLTIILCGCILFTWVGWIRVDHFAFMNVVGMLNDVMGCVVAFIPEGMPVGVALTLMIIARRMKSANVLPKGLSTVETLGCVNVICSDKTGTLTRNEMVVTSVGFVNGRYEPRDMNNELADTNKAPNAAFYELWKASILCNDAVFDSASMHLPPASREVQGNATDAAVLKFAETAQSGEDLVNSQPRVFQIPFNSKIKWMLTMHDVADDADYEKDSVSGYSKYLVYVKGAPDVILPHCSTYLSAETHSVEKLDQAALNRLSELQEKLSRNAERVIILCKRYFTPISALGSNGFGDEIMSDAIEDLTVIGIVGITDPPRAETASTVASCRKAGARFFMVTGDFGLTAAAIGRSVGILTGERAPDSLNELNDVKEYHHSLLLEGPQIAKLTEEQWETVCSYEEIVFARTTPEQKLRIVNEFKARDNVVAVTGDGVNDAPALKAADVGVAVVSGSDVAIEAADLVLLDKFDSIIEAIRLGRLVFQNLQKVITYLLPAGSWSEIWPVLLNVFFGVPLPLSSFLMIIICIFTDLFLSLSLIMEKEEFDLLTLPPRNHKKDHLINLKIYCQAYLFIGVMETLCAMGMFFLYMQREAGISFHEMVFLFEGYSEGFHGYSQEELTHFNNTGQCVYFVSLVIMQWGNILSIRNKRLSILQADPIRPARRNPWLFVSMLISLAIAIFVTEVPAIHSVFSTASVPIMYWVLPLPLALGILIMDEMRKLVVRSFPKSFIAKIAW